jgi:chorismate lyase/3-hydroxybenzoate synthase
MIVSSFSKTIPNRVRKVEMLSPPDWAAQISGIGLPAVDSSRDDFGMGINQSDRFARIAVCIPDAANLEAVAVRERTRLCYGKIFRTLAVDRALVPVRFWNFLPQIHDLIDEKQSRYMVFNAGRFLAFQDQYGDSRVFDRNVATASAVGHAGRDLWIHCLAAAEPAINLGNPRQVSPHRYSERFGRLPPCFARATLLPERSTLLIAGTASICGEDSLHHDLDGQLRETLANLATVIEIGRSKFRAQTSDLSPDSAHAGPCEMPRRSDSGVADSLRALTDIRIYHPRSSDLHVLNDYLRQRLGDRPRLEFLAADLCRSELLVEIEAIADLSDRQGACT